MELDKLCAVKYQVSRAGATLELCDKVGKGTFAVLV
jgi:hypothetical protein